MLRFLMLVVAASAYCCAQRVAPALQAFAFDSGDPVSITSLFSLLGAGIFVFTAELRVVLSFQAGGLLACVPALLRHNWLLSSLAFAWIAAVTLLVHLMFPTRRKRNRSGRTHN